MKIIKATEPIPVEHPVFLLFGQPGIGKSSLGYSTKDPLLLDFDKGAHRASNRRDTLVIDVWKDVMELMENADALEPYSALTVDTVGQCLNVITAHIALTDPKKAPGGNLALQGWGVLKSSFRNWIGQLRTKGKDVLLIAHDKEDKDGDSRIVRPDIAGASFGEVMKTADFVGYMYMAGRRRILDFNPTDKWIGKNPANWEPFEVPPVAKAQSFMADLYERGREALGALSEESSLIMQQVEDWRTAIAGYATVEDCNSAVAEIKQQPPMVFAQASVMLMARTKALGFTFDKAQKKFVAPEPATV